MEIPTYLKVGPNFSTVSFPLQYLDKTTENQKLVVELFNNPNAFRAGIAVDPVSYRPHAIIGVVTEQGITFYAVSLQLMEGSDASSS